MKEKLLKILMKHNQPRSAPEDVLFKLLSPYCLYKTLAKGRPYLADDTINADYVLQCLTIACETYKQLGFGDDLLVIYEDFFSENNREEIEFFESCLKDPKRTKAYTFQWKQRPMEGTYPAALANNSDIYTCTRMLYTVKGIDAKRLFREIILSDLEGSYNLCSKIFIIDAATSCIFHLYDDRGLWISAPEGVYFPQLGTAHDEISDMEYEDISAAEYRFSIFCEDFHWIKGVSDDPEDLCLHGKVHVLIGAEGFAYPCCVSAAALRMLKTLTEDHEVTNSGEQMLPCCNSLIANEMLDCVSIIGCDNGIDWAVRHEGDNYVRLLTCTGRQALVKFDLYRKEVYRFADEVEAFYKSSSPKILPEDTMEREGYQAFWNEWHRRRNA